MTCIKNQKISLSCAKVTIDYRWIGTCKYILLTGSKDVATLIHCK